MVTYKVHQKFGVNVTLVVFKKYFSFISLVIIGFNKFLIHVKNCMSLCSEKQELLGKILDQKNWKMLAI